MDEEQLGQFAATLLKLFEQNLKVIESILNSSLTLITPFLFQLMGEGLRVAVMVAYLDLNTFVFPPR
jgi:hypothetical protein